MKKFKPGDRAYVIIPEFDYYDLFEVIGNFPLSSKVHVKPVGEKYTTSFYEIQLEHKAVVESPLWQELK